MARLDRLTPDSKHGHKWALVETPQGSNNKLRYRSRDDAFEVSASLPAGMAFPFDFGFFPGTKAPDGDPLDVLVLMDSPAYPGVLVETRLLGVIEATQSDDDGQPYRNDRLIAIAVGSTERGDVRRLSDLDSHLVDQIEAFFGTYDRLLGKQFTPVGRRGPAKARRLLEQARR
jgi:inorganic pyrophosphatase